MYTVLSHFQQSSLDWFIPIPINIHFLLYENSLLLLFLQSVQRSLTLLSEPESWAQYFSDMMKGVI